MTKLPDHVLIPKHEVVPTKEKQELLSKLNIKKKQLPKILAKDPMIKHIDAKVGDVIKITRKSLTSGESVYYRIVVD